MPEHPLERLVRGEADETFPLERTPDGKYKLRELTCYDCGGAYTLPRSAHLSTERHRTWLASQQRDPQIRAFDGPIRDEHAEPIRRDLTKINFGDVRICHRCKGKLRPERMGRDGKKIPADTACMDPQDPSIPCRACKGVGVQQLSKA